jgi:hypothetical protein
MEIDNMAQNVFQFFIEPGLQEVYRDKDTGLPLSGGYIEYWKDTARTVQKPVYKLSGTPQDPVYVPLVNPLPLTSIGTTSDGGGNDIKVYYNPYDDLGNEELYFIKVFNSQGVLQFTREGWPEQINTSTASNVTFIENFYQDGQFLNHIDVTNNGVLTQNTTNVSYGGWVFLLSNGFTSTNKVLFEKFPDYVTNPEASPRFSLRFSCVNPNPAEDTKDLVWVNNDVNFLAGVTITVQFEALSNTGFPGNVDLLYEKVFGTGGSPSITTYVTSFTINAIDWTKYTASFTVSTNFAQTISTTNDDEIRFIIRFPSDVVTDISVVNFVSAEGQFTVLTYPQASKYQAAINSLASSIQTPAYDGSNVGDVLTLGGTTSTFIGESGTPLAALVWLPPTPTGVVNSTFSTSVTPPPGWLFCDGTSYDLVGQFSSDEYVRLFDVIQYTGWYGEDTFIPLYTATGTYKLTATVYNAAPVPNAHASGFTVTITTTGTTSVFQVVTVVTTPASSIPPGSYFEVFSPTLRSSIYWFSIDGLGADPSNLFPTSLVQEISLLSTDTSDDVANALVANTNTQLRVPDLRGMFLRGWDNGRGIDPDSNTRGDPVYFSQVIGDVIGSAQRDALQSHTHTVFAAPLIGSSGSNSGAPGGNTQTSAPNGAFVSSETRPFNIYCNYIIKT